MSLRQTVVKFTKQVWHYDEFWHAQMEGRQVHIPDEFDDVPSPVFSSILDIEKAWDMNPIFHFSIQRDTIQLIPYQYLPFWKPEDNLHEENFLKRKQVIKTYCDKVELEAKKRS